MTAVKKYGRAVRTENGNPAEILAAAGAVLTLSCLYLSSNDDLLLVPLAVLSLALLLLRRGRMDAVLACAFAVSLLGATISLEKALSFVPGSFGALSYAFFALSMAGALMRYLSAPASDEHRRRR